MKNKLAYKVLVAGAVFLIGLSTWGTYTYSPDKNKEFYIYYVLFTVGCVILGIAMQMAFDEYKNKENLLPLKLQEESKIISFLDGKTIDCPSIINSFKSMGVLYASIDKPLFEWGELIKSVETIDLAFKSNITWVEAYRKDILSFCQKTNSKLRVLLPNPDNLEIVNQIANQRDRTPSKVREDIINALKIFSEIKKSSQGDVQIHLSDTVFLSHYYILSNFAIVTIRSLNFINRSPHFVCEAVPGSKNELYNFCISQYNEMWNRRSFPYIKNSNI